ncbi:MAG: hypothetical protein ICV87_13330, partial [Gemmatimonadetes bacterium]|nr:hypothetical protein [Gemmatimonadota bacterium]
MGRPSERDNVLSAVRAYLEGAREELPSRKPISMSAVARATGYHRNTLINHGLGEEITDAARVQARHARTAAAKRSAAQDEAVTAAKEEALRMRMQISALLGRILMAEGNAQRLGVDPA